MAAKRGAQKKSALKTTNPKRKISRTRSVQAEIGADDVKRMIKAPGDYQGIARKFADALESTKFRGTVSPGKLHSMIARGERLTQRAIPAPYDAGRRSSR